MKNYNLTAIEATGRAWERMDAKKKKKVEGRIQPNMGLVGHMMKRIKWGYAKKEEMEEEGAIALWKASVSYDEEKGVRFSTYACIVIYRALVEFVRSKEREFVERPNPYHIKKIEAKEESKYFCGSIAPMLRHLDKREEEIIRRLADGERQSDIAKSMKLTRQRIGQLKNTAIKKLKRLYT